MRVFRVSLLLTVIVTATVLFESATYAAVFNGKIAFSAEPAEGGGLLSSLNSEIYTVNADGSGRYQLINNDLIFDGYADWSPDGRKIAFVSTRDGGQNIYTMNADGTDLRQLTEQANRHLHSSNPDWSPDGSKIAYASKYKTCARSSAACRDTSYRWQIFTMDSEDGENKRQITFGSPSNYPYDVRNQHPRWSPDGRKIAYVRTSASCAPRPYGCVNAYRKNSEIYIAHLLDDGSVRNHEQITRNSDEDIYDSDPAWSPSGNELAFASDRNGNDEIYVVNGFTPLTSPKIRLTWNDDTDDQPTWSPDGRKIAFSSDRDGGERDIFVMERYNDGTHRPVNKSRSSGFIDTWPSWQLVNIQVIVGDTLRDLQLPAKAMKTRPAVRQARR